MEEKDFRAAIDTVVDPEELARINNLLELGHMPITSKEVLATMFGVNPGIIWSFINRNHKHYRRFSIPKGRGQRDIVAPKVGLKIVQKWISVQLQRKLSLFDHVFGFIPGRSHLDAATRHTNAKWVYSVDIENFFTNTKIHWVNLHLMKFGYDAPSASLITSLCCYWGALPQGAPSSPVLSNISMMEVDDRLSLLSAELGVRMTRYADDITFSSNADFPDSLPESISRIFEATPWRIATNKTHFSRGPARLKVHGLIVNDGVIKLTKGYRNKLRAYNHMVKSGKCNPEDIARLSGHLVYAKHVADYQK